MTVTQFPTPHSVQTCSCGRRYRIPTNLEVCELSHQTTAVKPKTCAGFAWLGQPFYACDACGEPFWEHDKMTSPPDPKSSPFSKQLFQFDVISDEMKASVRRRWEPAMIRAGYVPPSRRL